MWGFAVHPPRMVEAAPKHGEFFASDVRNSAHALIRELTQNSGDAAIDAETEVRLTFQFTTIDAATFKDRYLTALPHKPTLREHLIAANVRPPLPLDEDGPVPLLVIEDFGTTGLTGAFDASNQEKSAFLAFWKRYGSSSKGDADGGRHGIGKSVVPNSSRIFAFFGVTHRYDDHRELMMGQVVLRPHPINGQTYDSFGQFSPSMDDEWAMPFEGEMVEHAKADFQLQRRDEPGLSLIVPYPMAEITPQALSQAAVEHCFHQILSGHLRLEIDDVVLSKDTLLDFVATHGDPKLRAAVQLSAEVASGKLEIFEPKEGELRQRLAMEHFSDEALAKMRDLYRQGRTVAVRLPVEIRPREGDRQIGHVFLYLRRAAETSEANETYVRGRVTVPGQQRVLVGASALGLLVADQGPVSRFLGDSEGVSHVKWVMNKLRDKYLSVEEPFRRIRDGLGDLQRILVDEAEDRHIKNLLKDFFWQPKRPEEEVHDDKDDDDDIPDIESQKPAVLVQRLAGGFELKVSDEIEDPLHIRLDVGYAVRRGSAKWSAADFTLGESVTLLATGDGDLSFEGNRIRVTNALPGFHLVAKGFDPNRDVLVHVNASEEP